VDARTLLVGGLAAVVAALAVLAVLRRRFEAELAVVLTLRKRPVPA
jgi:hypothetical protein